ncbi:PCYCGC motif-containing (lipo)protein [Solibacillus sp. FSL H8-0538]|uniref:PCYCGC motif-containing (lipo)protein n=1 Tax=Solibacillus sp. FSL H8-0538 TaxID=2921400 RepID=UPI0030F51C67
MKKFSITVILLLVLSACGQETVTHQHEEKEAVQSHVSGDIQEVTTGPEILPSFLDDKNETIRLSYQVAANYSDVLEWVPCYCGCGDSVGHRNNLNCFIQERHADGTITWDDHGTRCNVCIEIAIQAAQMSKDGVELKDIREKIDSMYKEGYATPTNTEMPA